MWGNAVRPPMRHTLGMLAILTLAACANTSAYAEGSVSSLGMGMGAPTSAAFARFQAVVAQYNASGERFRIDGHCQSACTMFLAIQNVCITPNATLLFHAGGSMQKGIISPAYTQQMLDTYNSALRQYVTDNHFMDTFAFHAISARDMIKRFGYKGC